MAWFSAERMFAASSSITHANILPLAALVAVIACVPPLTAAPPTLAVKSELLPRAGETAGQFGWPVASNEHFIAVGAPGAALAGGSNQATVYVDEAATLW